MQSSLTASYRIYFVVLVKAILAASQLFHRIITFESPGVNQHGINTQKWTRCRSVSVCFDRVFKQMETSSSVFETWVKYSVKLGYLTLICIT